MHLRPDNHPRIHPARPREPVGNVSALIRASRETQTDAESIAEFPDDAITRKRRLVAMFCKMLGDQLEGQTPRENVSPPASLLTRPLSPRQRQTLKLLLAGHAEKQIAARLAISRHTVHVYVKSLYKCFSVCSRAELLARWVQR